MTKPEKNAIFAPQENDIFSVHESERFATNGKEIEKPETRRPLPARRTIVQSQASAVTMR